MSGEASHRQPLLAPSEGAANAKATTATDEVAVDVADDDGNRGADGANGLRYLAGSVAVGGKRAKLLFDAERMIAFTDAVVAIAMTLLILPLMESAVDMGDDEPGSPSERTSVWFDKHSKNLVSLAISYSVIFKYWADHDRLFRYVGKFTYWLIQLNVLWMGGVVFLPVAAALIMAAGNDGDRIANAAYVGTMAGISLVKFAMTLVVRGDEKMWKHSSRRPGPLMVAHDVITLSIILLALLISLLVPSSAVLTLVLFIAQRPIMHLLVERLKPHWTY